MVKGQKFHRNMRQSQKLKRTQLSGWKSTRRGRGNLNRSFSVVVNHTLCVCALSTQKKGRVCGRHHQWKVFLWIHRFPIKYTAFFVSACIHDLNVMEQELNQRSGKHSTHTQTLNPSMNTRFLCPLSKAPLDVMSAKKPAATRKWRLWIEEERNFGFVLTAALKLHSLKRKAGLKEDWRGHLNHANTLSNSREKKTNV